jgi:hypothetical protein
VQRVPGAAFIRIAADFVPVIGNAVHLATDLADLPHEAADTYRYAVVATARRAAREGTLSTAARHALHRYLAAAGEEQRAYHQLARELERAPSRV